MPNEHAPNPEHNERQEFRTFAEELAREAGEIIMGYYGKINTDQAEWTSKTHFRTECDVEIGKLIREKIEDRFPEHNILSEEQDPREVGSQYTWVVDELDGTIPFLRGTTDHFSFCVALCEGKTPVLGIVNAVNRKEKGELYVAEKDKGATCNGVPIEVGKNEDLNKTFLGVDSGKTNRTAHLPYLERLLQPDGITCDSRTACASVPLALVAKGNFDAYLATSLQPEDMAAAVCIIREAGGKVTDLWGKEWELGEPSILAANPVLHQKLLEKCLEVKPERVA